MMWEYTAGEMQLGTVRMCPGVVHRLVGGYRQINDDARRRNTPVDQEGRNLEDGQAIGLIRESVRRAGQQERRVRRVEGGQIENSRLG
jgi:hypothetical protein